MTSTIYDDDDDDDACDDDDCDDDDDDTDRQATHLLEFVTRLRHQLNIYQ